MNDGNWNVTIVMGGMNCERWKLECDYSNGRNEL